MDMHCPRCGETTEPAGHEDARAFYECRNCNRVWTAALTGFAGREDTHEARERLRVLVVDDSDDLLRLIAFWLEDEGYVVVTAGSGRQALDAATVYFPDIVLLDLILPPPDGFHVCEALKHHLAPYVILMTGLSDPEHLQRAAQLGVVGLLRKPLTREAVVHAVDAAAERCRRDPLARLRWHFGMYPRAG